MINVICAIAQTSLLGASYQSNSQINYISYLFLYVPPPPGARSNSAKVTQWWVQRHSRSTESPNIIEFQLLVAGIVTSDKGEGKCVYPRLYVCLTISKITHKRVHQFG